MSRYKLIKKYAGHIPNAISLSRLGFTVVTMVSIYFHFYVWAVMTMLSVIISDVVDGWMARRYNLMSSKGAILDIVVDKISTFCVVAMLLWVNDIPRWFGIMLIVKDLLMVLGWLLMSYMKGKWQKLEASFWGKRAGFIIFIVLFLTLCCFAQFEYLPIAWFCNWRNLWYGFSLMIVYLALINYSYIAFNELRNNSNLERMNNSNNKRN